jgi:hypothetical protein
MSSSCPFRPTMNTTPSDAKYSSSHPPVQHRSIQALDSVVLLAMTPNQSLASNVHCVFAIGTACMPLLPGILDSSMADETHWHWERLATSAALQTFPQTFLQSLMNDNSTTSLTISPLPSGRLIQAKYFKHHVIPAEYLRFCLLLFSNTASALPPSFEIISSHETAR